jgi:tetratricopeptide (TPR) repeat protein
MGGAILLVLVAGTSAWWVWVRKISLEVVTAPPGAVVRVDNVEVGVSPVQVLLSRGAHAVKARLEGYEEAAEVVDLAGNTRSVVINLRKDLQSTASHLADPIRAKAEALYQEGRALLARGKLEQAEAKFHALEALVPDDGRAAQGLAAVQKRAKGSAGQEDSAQGGNGAGGRRGGADDSVSAALSRMKPAQRKAAAQEHLDQARTAYDMGEMGRAKELLSKCLRFDASQVQCHRIMARVLTKEDNVPKVKYHLQRYLELGGSDEDFKVRDWLKSH